MLYSGNMESSKTPSNVCVARLCMCAMLVACMSVCGVCGFLHTASIAHTCHVYTGNHLTTACLLLSAVNLHVLYMSDLVQTYSVHVIII